jgi:hypothetical protein
MKKLLFAAALIIAGTGLFAQAQPKPAAAPEKSKMTVVKKETAKEPAKVVPVAKTTAPVATATGPTKKDGTADMRYKKNKEASKPAPAGPTKKDGTADMRYKANKEAPKKKS